MTTRLTKDIRNEIIERMPELERHLPAVAKSFPLVAPSNVMSRLSKLGFDRTVTA